MTPSDRKRAVRVASAVLLGFGAVSAACSAGPLATDTQSPSAANTSTPTATSAPAPTAQTPSATLQPTPPAQVTTALPEDLVAALEASGTHIGPPDGSVPVSNSDVLAAIDVARAQFGPAGSAIAFPATVTVDGYHVGDESSPLAIDHRQVIVVQITGLELRPIGGYGMSFTPEDNNHELIVYVDARTGEYLLASSDR